MKGAPRGRRAIERGLNLRAAGISVVMAALLSGLCGCRPATPAAGPTLFQATLVLRGPYFASEEGRIVSDGVVLVGGDRVLCSGQPADCPYPGDVPVEGVRDGTIVPGLIDLHVHARPHYVGAFLPGGVTTIRDASNNLAVVDSLRSAPGAPRVVASGPLIDGPTSTMLQMSPDAGELGDRPIEELNPVLVPDPAAAAEAVHAIADEGVDFVKLYQRLSPRSFQAAVAAAGARSLPAATDLGMILTGGLTGSEVDIVDAARAGVHTVEHLSGLALAYQRRGGDPLSPPYDPEILDGIAGDLLATGVAVVPTIATILQFADPEALDWSDVPGAQLAPYFDAWWQARAELAGRNQAAVAADRTLSLALLRRLHEGGMRIGAGSDLPAAPGMPPGGALHVELAALVQAGLAPAEALQAATWHAAELLGRADLGHLGEGARADILIVDGDPIRDIRATRNIRAVWLGGARVDLEAAWEATVDALRSTMEESDS